MRALQLRRVLKISVLAPVELRIGWTNSTRLSQSLWDELDQEHRDLMVRMLKKVHKKIGRDITNARTYAELARLNAYVDSVLTREAVIAASSREFGPHAVALKDIILDAIGTRMNMDVEMEDEPPKRDQGFISWFVKIVRRCGF